MAIGGIGGSSQPSCHDRVGAASARLAPEEQQQVNHLKAIDRKVHAHEQAHMAAGAGVTGGASFEYARGPDGRQYAVAGEVSINVSAGQTPQSTIERARKIQAAALAPIDPSPQDRAVAAAAAMMEGQARAELSRVKQEEQSGDSSSTTTRPLSPIQQAAALLAYATEALSKNIESNRTEPNSIDQYA